MHSQCSLISHLGIFLHCEFFVVCVLFPICSLTLYFCLDIVDRCKKAIGTRVRAMCCVCCACSMHGEIMHHFHNMDLWRTITVFLTGVNGRLFITLVLVSGFGYQFVGFGYQLFVMRHFFVWCAGNMFQVGGGWAHYEKSDTLQKKVTHYKKLVPETRKLVPETRNKNQCYCRPRWMGAWELRTKLLVLLE